MKLRPLFSDKPLPILVTPEDGSGNHLDDLTSWIEANRRVIDDCTHRAGVVLLRGFRVASPHDFRAVCMAIRSQLRNYVGGDSPRHSVTDQVYTSTEYAAGLEVLLHNELSYAGWSPERVFFGCLATAAVGGETPVADGREIYARLDPSVRDRFEDSGVTYLQHLRDGEGEPGPGKSWQETFETNDRSAAEAYLADAGIAFEWTELGIRTAATHPAVLQHTVTGEKCWHNQADQWHRRIESVKHSVSNSPDVDSVSESAGTQTIGNHVTYGDGNEIDISDLLHVRATARACEVVFPWQAGDVMVIDNVIAMHGRKPFSGERRVLVAMA